jgi:hypothetical protein
MTRMAKTLALLAETLRRLAVPYVVVGSVASSTRGRYRATEDVDILARVSANQADALAAGLGRDWYADPLQIREAIAAGRAFNLIYIPFSQKVDIFPAVDAFSEIQLRRATNIGLPFPGEEGEFPVASAEDTVLAKLRWYAEGGETSERQWTDITGLLRTNPALDMRHLETWAARLGVSRLLARAVEETGGS